jgi:hypothetical protein
MRARELKMLFYKHWLETRWGFLLTLAILLYFSTEGVLGFPGALRARQHDIAVHPGLTGRPPLTYQSYTQGRLQGLTMLWTIFAVMLGTSGLPKERRLGTASFLLSMPVGRRHLLVARSGVLAVECATLAIAGMLSISWESQMVGQSYPAPLALKQSALLLGGGAGYMAYGILISAFLESAYWPGIIGATTAFLSLVAYGAKLPPVGAGIALASAMLAVSWWIVKWQDF